MPLPINENVGNAQVWSLANVQRDVRRGLGREISQPFIIPQGRPIAAAVSAGVRAAVPAIVLDIVVGIVNGGLWNDPASIKPFLGRGGIECASPPNHDRQHHHYADKQDA